MLRLRRRVTLARRHAGLLLYAYLIVLVVRLGLVLTGYRPLLRRIVATGRSRRPAGNIHLAMWAIRHAARLVPGATCLTKAMAGQYFCARAGHAAHVRIGVQRRDDGSVAAHAWLVDDQAILIGGQEEDLNGFTPLVDLRGAAR